MSLQPRRMLSTKPRLGFLSLAGLPVIPFATTKPCGRLSRRTERLRSLSPCARRNRGCAGAHLRLCLTYARRAHYILQMPRLGRATAFSLCFVEVREARVAPAA